MTIDKIPGTDIVWPKPIYRQHELPQDLIKYFLDRKQGLIDDYLRGFSSLEAAANHETRGVATLDRRDIGMPIDDTMAFIPKVLDDGSLEFGEEHVSNWWSIGFRNFSDNEKEGMIHDILEPRDSEKAKTFPTAMDITYDLLDHCVMTTYSVIKPNAVLLRHSGPENRNGDYLRIHVPLIVPEGDIFLEANGEEVQFSEGIFGFNNQLLHSSHNYTDKYRLVFIIDLSFDFLKLPHPGKFKPEYHDFAKPFTRKEVYVSGKQSAYYRAISDLYREK